MNGEASETADGPRVAPDRPKASGDKGPRIAVALGFVIMASVSLLAATVLILWLL